MEKFDSVEREIEEFDGMEKKAQEIDVFGVVTRSIGTVICWYFLLQSVFY